MKKPKFLVTVNFKGYKFGEYLMKAKNYDEALTLGERFCKDLWKLHYLKSKNLYTVVSVVISNE